jgi:hypothetical protein
VAAAWPTIAQEASEDEPVWEYRDPKAWSAIHKYCIACHSAATIDEVELSQAGWDERIYQCQLYMASRGYPQPTAADKQALSAFLYKITPIDRKPPVHLWPPPRGGLAVP